ncbi:MAG: PIN domain-containing protein [Deltaproteobacteria bacterium]|nr:PIN domain-containing protein [Deltaproteobacteria bacterium]
MGDAQRFYLDTSVYLCVLLGEAPAAKVIRMIRQALLCSSVLLVIEAERNLVRLSRAGDLSPADYEIAIQRLRTDHTHFLLKEVTMELCLTGIFPPVSTPRSNDLLHLRTARWFQEHGGLTGFLTLDRHQRRAAEDFGLPVARM